MVKSLILMDAAGNIQIWAIDDQIRFNRKQMINFAESARYVSAVQHLGTSYLAVCTEHILNSTHYGSVEIYKYKFKLFKFGIYK